MNKSLLFAFIIFCVTAKAQTSVYHPFPDSAISWVENFGTGHSQICCCFGICVEERNYQYFLNGDTTIGSSVYKKIYKTGSTLSYVAGSPICPPWCPGNFQQTYYHDVYSGAIREDTAMRKVFLSVSDSVEALLYDFNLNIGDTLPPLIINTYYPFNYVASIDSILIGNSFHKRFNILPCGASLIEGIGSTFGLLYPLNPSFEFINTLTCVVINSSPVYPDTVTTCSLPTAIMEQEKEFPSVSLFPNPATTEIRITNSELKIESIEIYDVLGQLQTSYSALSNRSIDISPLLPGLYFIQLKTDKGIRTMKFIKQ